MTSAASSKSRLSAEDWVEAALEALADGGADAVRIERLCAQLGVTKGSFYWHFKGRDALVEAMVEHWANAQPLAVIERLALLDLPPMQKLERVMVEAARRGIGRRDHAMRVWAESDERAAAAIRAADGRVLDLFEGLLRDAGLSEVEAFTWSRTLFFTGIGVFGAPHALGRTRPQAFATRILAAIAHLGEKT